MEQSTYYISLTNQERKEKSLATGKTDTNVLKSRSELRKEITQATLNGAKRIVIQAAISYDTTILPDSLKYAAKKKIPHREIETSGLLESVQQNVAVLKHAGLTHALISLGTDNEPVSSDNDHISNDPEISFIGARNLIKSGIPTRFAIWITQRNILMTADLIKRIVNEFGPDCEIILMLENLEENASQGKGDGYLMLDRTLESIIKEEKPNLKIEERLSPAPCLMPVTYEYLNLPSEASLMFLLPDKDKPNEVCRECIFILTCPGINKNYLHTFPNIIKPLKTINPEAEKKYYQKLININMILTRFKFYYNDSEWEHVLIRTNFNCNERCIFCWVDPHFSNPPHKFMEYILEEILSEATSRLAIVFSGGEPTLNPHLPDYIKIVSDAGVSVIELQTNAVKLANPEYTRLLVKNGLTNAFISLHGHTPELSDRITQTPGSFTKTVAGAKNLADLGATVNFNFVMNKENYFTIPSYLEFIGSNFPRSAVMLSILGPKLALHLYRNALSRLSEQAPYVIEGKKMFGDKLVVFNSTCGMPPCLLKDGIELFIGELIPVTLDDDLRGVFHKKKICAGCAANDFCFGFWRNYVEVYGDDEMNPISDSPMIKKRKDMFNIQS